MFKPTKLAATFASFCLLAEAHAASREDCKQGADYADAARFEQAVAPLKRCLTMSGLSANESKAARLQLVQALFYTKRTSAARAELKLWLKAFANEQLDEQMYPPDFIAFFRSTQEEHKRETATPVKRPTEARATEPRSTETKAVETKNPEAKSVDSKTSDSTTSGARTSETKSVDAKASEHRSAEGRPTEASADGRAGPPIALGDVADASAGKTTVAVNAAATPRTNGAATEEKLHAGAAPNAPVGAPWYLKIIPFGVGHFANGDPVAGGVFLGIELAALGAHVAVAVTNQSSLGRDGGYPAGRKPLYYAQNVTVGVLAAACIVDVVDAFVWSDARAKRRLSVALNPVTPGILVAGTF